MALREELCHDKERDLVEGLEDLGGLGRTSDIANHALVLMARGLFVHWKQPIGYIITSGPIDGCRLQKLIVDCLDKIEEAGFSVRAIIADQGSNNRRAFQTLLKVSEEKPYFFNGQRKMYAF